MLYYERGNFEIGGIFISGSKISKDFTTNNLMKIVGPRTRKNNQKLNDPKKQRE